MPKDKIGTLSCCSSTCARKLLAAARAAERAFGVGLRREGPMAHDKTLPPSEGVLGKD
jgi:hypothetical protein